jgi:hypothetical protein
MNSTLSTRNHANQVVRDWYRAIKASAVNDFQHPEEYIIGEMASLITDLIQDNEERIGIIEKSTNFYRNIVKAEAA